jgi:hypothetical protein
MWLQSLTMSEVWFVNDSPGVDVKFSLFRYLVLTAGIAENAHITFKEMEIRH